MGMVESSITCDGEGLLLLGTSLVVVEDDIGYESSEAKHGGSWRPHEGRRESEGVESAVNFLCRKYLLMSRCPVFAVHGSRLFKSVLKTCVPPGTSQLQSLSERYVRSAPPTRANSPLFQNFSIHSILLEIELWQSL